MIARKKRHRNLSRAFRKLTKSMLNNEKAFMLTRVGEREREKRTKNASTRMIRIVCMNIHHFTIIEITILTFEARHNTLNRKSHPNHKWLKLGHNVRYIIQSTSKKLSFKSTNGFERVSKCVSR